MVIWNHGDFQPDSLEEAEDLGEEAGDVDLELIVLVDQYRPQDQFIVDVFSHDDIIPSGDLEGGVKVRQVPEENCDTWFIDI